MSVTMSLGYVAFSLAPTKFTVGRIRIRIPERHRDEAYFTKVGETLAQVSGVLDVKVNPRTTSVLIEHDREPDELLWRIHALKLFRLVRKEQIPLHLHRAAYPVFTQQEKETMKVLALLGLSLFQAARGHALGAGTSLLDEAIRYWERASAVGDATDAKAGTGNGRRL